ncbi:MAG TPA: hypothetical protein VHC63_03190, partial [Acidimicrobiales bacterium]|nr:hypothetical protein [Acidimicrobiales bacterium]
DTVSKELPDTLLGFETTSPAVLASLGVGVGLWPLLWGLWVCVVALLWWGGAFCVLMCNF